MLEIQELITDNNDPEDIFQLLDILGQGSYGSVSKALHKETGELYAIKILPATSGIQISSIKKQINVLKQCNDDHIVKYYGSYFKDNSLWIVMEYCVAGSITDIMQITKKQLNQFEIASIMESVLRGLEYLHAKKTIHRDVKAANILLDQRGHAKLADFGVSASAMYTNARFRTHIGSPYWMSPEIIRYSEYDQKTDIWSLGITAIEIAEGQVPNSHIKPYMVMFLLKTNPIQSLKEPTKWSPEFNSFIHKCLQIGVDKRPTAVELLQHEFIKKYSKGERLLAQLVLNSVEEIQEFRMNQSRNSSFAEILVMGDEDGSNGNRTIVQKQQNFPSEPEYNSMIINSSNTHSRQSSEQEQSSMIIKNNDSLIIHEKGQQSGNILTSYINEMKSKEAASSKCIEMMVKNIEGYDEKFLEEVQQIFLSMREKLKGEIQYLRYVETKENCDQTSITQNMLKYENFKQCLISLLPNNIQNLKKEWERENKKKYEHKQKQQHEQFFINVPHTQSINENQPLEHIGNQPRPKETKSMGMPFQRAFSKKQPYVDEKSVELSLQPSIQQPTTVIQSFNSSRILYNQQKKSKDSQTEIKPNLQQFHDDREVCEYLLTKFIPSEQVKQHHLEKSKEDRQQLSVGFPGAKKMYTQIPQRLQKSIEHSVSKGKNTSGHGYNNKSSKNLKAKKNKTRAC